MSNELSKIVLQESDLQLVISEKTLGKLTTNAHLIKALVEKVLPNYDISKYNEGNIEDAKKERALLNKTSKLLSSQRLEIEREFMKPFEEFKGVVNETVKLISECSAKIDTVVRESEDLEKANKRISIQTYFDGKGFTLVPLQKFFEEKWINKTAKLKDVFKEIDDIIVRIKEDITTIEALGGDIDILKSVYLDKLNLNQAIQYAKTLEEYKEKAQQEAEARESAKAQLEAPMQAKVAALESSEVTETKAEAKTESVPELLTRSFKVTATRENIIALGDFMNARGIQFEKI